MLIPQNTIPRPSFDQSESGRDPSPPRTLACCPPSDPDPGSTGDRVYLFAADVKPPSYALDGKGRGALGSFTSGGTGARRLS